MQNYQIQLPDGTVVGAGTSVGYTKAVGLRGAATLRNADVNRAGADGQVPGMSYIGNRTVGVTWLIANPVGGAEAALQILTRNWQNIANPSDAIMTAGEYLAQIATGGSKPVSSLQFQLPDRSDPLLVLGRPGKLEPPVDSSYQFGWIEIESDWSNLDGKIYGASVHSATITLTDTIGGGNFPWSFPVNFGPQSGSVLTAANNGFYPARPVYKIVGPCLNPIITNTSTREYVRVNVQVGANDTLIIDTNSRVVRLNGVNRNNTLDVGSTLFSIPPGGATLGFSSTDNGSVSGTVTAYTLDTYSAV